MHHLIKRIITGYGRTIQDPFVVRLKKYDPVDDSYAYVAFYDALGAAYMDRLYDKVLDLYVSETGRYLVEIYVSGYKIYQFETDLGCECEEPA